MRLPELSIQRPVLATMMSLALVLFGAISLSRLPVRELPDIDPPIVNVTTVYPEPTPRWSKPKSPSVWKKSSTM